MAGWPTVDEVAVILEARAAGREATFGSQAWLEDLRSRIGRDEDSNTNLTRRMLFVMESVPVAGEDVYLRARRALLTGYLQANVKHHRPPRFLPNDVIRYWRTMAVEFEGKMRARKGEGWGPVERQASALAQGFVRRRPVTGARVLPVHEQRHARLPRRADVDSTAGSHAQHSSDIPATCKSGSRSCRELDAFARVSLCQGLHAGGRP
jgi:hypothetical protein